MLCPIFALDLSSRKGRRASRTVCSSRCVSPPGARTGMYHAAPASTAIETPASAAFIGRSAVVSVSTANASAFFSAFTTASSSFSVRTQV